MRRTPTTTPVTRALSGTLNPYPVIRSSSVEGTVSLRIACAFMSSCVSAFSGAVHAAVPPSRASVVAVVPGLGPMLAQPGAPSFGVGLVPEEPLDPLDPTSPEDPLDPLDASP